MNLFIRCEHCKIPVLITQAEPFCPFCKRAMPDLHDAIRDEFDDWIEDYRQKSYFSWEEIQKLLGAVQYLTEINNKTCREYGKALIELDKLKTRLEWYREQLMRGIKL